MTLVTIIFYFFIASATVATLGILLSKNVFKSALLLLVVLLSLAAIYVIAFAEFVAVTQILIYAGGIAVVIIFGIMLTSKITGKAVAVANGNLFGGVLGGLTLMILLGNFISDEFNVQATENVSPEKNIETIGTGFMTSYALPFELAGVLLLVALIGAAVISSTLKSEKT